MTYRALELEIENMISRIEDNQSDGNYIHVSQKFCELNKEKLKELGIELVNVEKKSDNEYDVFLQVNPPIKHVQIDFKI